MSINKPMILFTKLPPSPTDMSLIQRFSFISHIITYKHEKHKTIYEE